MSVKFKFDSKKWEKKLREKRKSVRDAIHNNAQEIHNIIHKGVWDNTNWNPQATYSVHDPNNKGEKYDLVHTGTWHDLLQNENINAIFEGNKVKIPYASVDLLDLEVPYWRTFYYGRDAIDGLGYTPTEFSTSPRGKIKHKGYLREGEGIKAIEPTWMFDVWHMSTGRELNEYINSVLDKAWSK